MSREYNIYQNMVEASKTANVDENLTFDCTSSQNEMLFFLATELAKEAAPNPLNASDPGYNEYEDVLYFYATWPDNKPNCALKKRFLYAAYQLCKLCPENIFEYEEEPVVEFSLEELKEKEYAETENEDIASDTYVPVQEPKRIFGVVPFDDDDDNYAINTTEDPIEEKPRGLFRRNKKRQKN